MKDSLDTIRILDELQVEREAEELAENSSSEEVRGTDEENPQE